MTSVNLLRVKELEAKVERLEAELKAEKHVTNEWADCASNAHQWVKNIAEGISDPKAALENLKGNLAHCMEVAQQAHEA